jgi:hypothetical protein
MTTDTIGCAPLLKVSVRGKPEVCFYFKTSCKQVARVCDAIRLIGFEA